MSSSSLLIKNIHRIWQYDPHASLGWQAGEEMKQINHLENAWILCESDRIQEIGTMDACPEGHHPILDAKGGDILPSWVDSHTHLVFARTREDEFRYRLEGMSYEEIANKGGGILNSAYRLRETSEEELLEGARKRLDEVIRKGTGAIEIKSGYGLTLESEIKMLRVIRRLRDESTIPIRATLLAAHALPKEFKEDRVGYIRLIVDEILPRVADEGLADYIDTFCEKVFFQPEEMAQILEAGARYGLKGKVHTNQFYSIGGIQTAIAQGALSVDHMEVATDQDIEDLLESNVYPVLLPSAPFFLRDHYPPARQMIDAGLGVVLASDYNPGTSPSGNMPLVIALACTQMRMLPEEAIHAATINGACALEWENELGSIAPGKRANLLLTQPIPSLAYLPYAFGSDWIEKRILNGKEFI
ncbi:MAG: imidazolonepropionase [Saprospiraceae bacterium]|nr:imidazolonepropionase [Saprospiraceae bacterium]